VKAMRKALTAAAVLGLAVAGCSAAAHIGQLQPPKLTAQPASALAPPHPVTVRKPRLQLGAGIDLYTYRGQNFTKSATTEVAYLKALHANSVIVSFPFFMHGEKAAGVYTKVSTPTPAQLAVFVETAEDAGLYVSLRPLLDETSLGEPRNNWRPRHPAAWFASYQKFLVPYARMAQRTHLPRLYVGTEFQDFGSSPRWNGLDRSLRRAYHGTLAYANNGHKLHPGSGGRGAQISADAYPDMPQMPATASIARLTTAWKAWDRIMPRGTVLSEVGISGVRGAYRTPWVHSWSRPQMDPAVQTRWFTAACRAMAATHLGGIYYWAIGFGKAELQTPLSAKNPAAWEKGPGEQAVAACFRQLSRG
jgi:hypothetical protein